MTPPPAPSPPPEPAPTLLAAEVPEPAAISPAASLTEPEAEQIAREAHAVIDEIATVVEGKPEIARICMLVLLSGGHLLIEDIPGVGKTMLAKSLAAALGASRHRIQFTPDLLPGDVTGASIFNQATSQFEFRRGAVFTHVLLADEINRASPKTQSALLEAMEERQVSVDGVTYELEEPFMVVATANPVEMEGTYRLPEAQRDRFLAQTTMGYPVASAEARMLRAQTGPVPPGDRDLLDAVTPRSSPAVIAGHIHDVRRVYAAPRLLDYVVQLASATRSHRQVTLGASPRAAVHLVRAAKAHAAIAGRPFVSPEDVRAMALPVWQHRLHLSPQALSRGVSAADVLHEVLDTTPLQ